MRSDAPEAGFWHRLAAAVPQAVKIAGTRDAPAMMAEIAAELAARQQARPRQFAAGLSVIYNLGRFRDLRKEDDFGFSAATTAAAQPGQAVHHDPARRAAAGHSHPVWCDTYSNVTRLLDRQSMQDFEMRVLFQMNANDSSSLIDSPEASRLGVHRAIFYDEGQGLLEKFRPYGLPTPEYLAWVKKNLHGRA